MVPVVFPFALTGFYFRLRTNYMEMIEAIAECYLNNLNLLSNLTLAYFLCANTRHAPGF